MSIAPGADASANSLQTKVSFEDCEIGHTVATPALPVLPADGQHIFDCVADVARLHTSQLISKFQLDGRTYHKPYHY